MRRERNRRKNSKGAVNHVNADDWAASNSTSDIFGIVHHVSDVDYSTQSFLIDSGATHHLVRDRNLLYDVISTPTITFGLAGAGSLSSTEKGTLRATGDVSIGDVYHVPRGTNQHPFGNEA